MLRAYDAARDLGASRGVIRRVFDESAVTRTDTGSCQCNVVRFIWNWKLARKLASSIDVSLLRRADREATRNRWRNDNREQKMRERERHRYSIYRFFLSFYEEMYSRDRFPSVFSLFFSVSSQFLRVFLPRRPPPRQADVVT